MVGRKRARASEKHIETHAVSPTVIIIVCTPDACNAVDVCRAYLCVKMCAVQRMNGYENIEQYISSISGDGKLERQCKQSQDQCQHSATHSWNTRTQKERAK